MASKAPTDNLISETLQAIQGRIDKQGASLADIATSSEALRLEAEGLTRQMKQGDGNGTNRAQNNARVKIEKMSSEVVDSNPYSRLMALQRMGIVKDYERIRGLTVAVVGMGGVGSVAAEMLTRCGIGRLLLYDYDTVELANMNRLFFRPEQAGMSKTDAAAQTLGHINPDVRLEGYTQNITTLAGFTAFKTSLCNPSGASRVDLVLSCVDNYEARMTINQVCLELQQTWMESGVSEDAVSGHIQVVVPGETACFACVPPLVVASGVDERTLKREGVCAASLPTTMGIVAGFLVQNSLKHLLSFGQVTRYLGYSSLTDFFPSMEIRPNPSCPNPLCRELQVAFQKRFHSPEARAARLAAERERQEAEEAPLHEENEWQIQVVPEGAASGPQAGENKAEAGRGLAPGLQYELPAADIVPETTTDEVPEDPAEDLDSLMAQLNSLSK